jgi:hypothetical protein
VHPFRLATKAGGMEVKVVEVDPVHVEKDQLERLNYCHQFIIEEVILRFEKELEEQFDFELDFKNPHLGLSLVLVENGTVNFELMDRISTTPPIDWRAHPKGDVHYDPARYVDAVVIP